MLKNDKIHYVFYVVLLLLLSLGLERKLIFWEWYFGGGWWRPFLAPLWAASFAASIAVCVGTLQLFMFRNLLIRILVFVYTMVCFAFIFFMILMEDRMPVLSDVMITFDGLKDFAIMGLTIFQTYPKQILLSAAVSFVMTAGLALVGNRAARLPKSAVRPWLPLVLYVAGFAFFLYVPTMFERMPVYGKTPLVFVRGLYESAHAYMGPRADPELEPVRKAAHSSHILFIMDESIAGYALSLNGFYFNTTPFLDGLPGPYFNNYGLASSAGNYSSVSNLLVVSGMRADQLPDERQIALRQATIFGYAAHAGRKAYYVDAQNSRLMNMLSTKDLPYMEYVPIINRLDAFEYPPLDRIALKRVAGILEEATEPVFVFLLKTGAHVPYGNKFPETVNYPDLDFPLSEPREYLFAIRWAVDDFFREVEKELSGKNVLVVYTSDHGQTVRFDGGTGPTGEFRNLRYGSRNNPDPREASVPIFVWAMSDKALSEYEGLGGFRRDNFNKSSHFQLFSSLLMLMGYGQEETRQRFGNSLFDEPPEKRVFATSYYITPETDGDVFEYKGIPETE